MKYRKHKGTYLRLKIRHCFKNFQNLKDAISNLDNVKRPLKNVIFNILCKRHDDLFEIKL